MRSTVTFLSIIILMLSVSLLSGCGSHSGDSSSGTPFLATPQKITASDAQMEDLFGYSVSISGDYAIVGELFLGAAYIFHRTGTNTWDAGTKIVAPDAQTNDNFGWSVSIGSDYAIVGASLEDGGAGDPLPNAGAAYIFHRTGTNTWDAGTKIVAPDAQTDDCFGSSVSISGDYVIVGAHGEDGGEGDPISIAGAAYIFRRTGTNTWDTGSKIVAPDAQMDDRFGSSVSISGDYAIVGAYIEDGGAGDPADKEGAAYIFHRTDTNAWDAGTKIAALDAQAGDYFGISVSISGDYAVVGASGEDGGAGDPLSNAGAAYVFHRTGPDTWDAGAKIVALDAQADDRFGWSVSITTGYAIVGAWGEDGGNGDPLIDAGAAYIFNQTEINTWDVWTKVVAPDAQTNDWFGSVSISGNHAIVGANGEDGGAGDSLTDSGAAYIY